MRYRELIETKLKECDAGTTTASNVATVVAPLGAQPAVTKKKKKTKPVLLRR